MSRLTADDIIKLENGCPYREATYDHADKFYACQLVNPIPDKFSEDCVPKPSCKQYWKTKEE